VVDRPSGEQRDGGAEPAGQLLQGEQPQAGGGQLDGQGQAVQPGHHLGDQRRVVGAQDEMGVDGRGPVGEQGQRVIAPRVGGQLLGPGQRQRSQRVLLLAGQPQGCPTGRQHRQPWGGIQQLGYHQRCR
jgi:hypothetical protein